MKLVVAVTVLLSVLAPGVVAAQKNTDRFGEVTLGLGDKQTTAALAYTHNWRLGKSKKFAVGLGAKFTSYFGSDINYSTAPAKLTSGKTGPGVLFSDDIPQNIDTFFVPKSQINFLNVTLNLGYYFAPKWYAGFTIDAIGFSFGKQQRGSYFANGQQQGTPVAAKPTAFNLLLTSDNDLGSLNSEFFVRYNFNNKWGAKLGYQFLFAEYTTNTKVQTTPTGQRNDRFRNKMSGLGLGVTYAF